MITYEESAHMCAYKIIYNNDRWIDIYTESGDNFSPSYTEKYDDVNLRREMFIEFIYQRKRYIPYYLDENIKGKFNMFPAKTITDAVKNTKYSRKTKKRIILKDRKSTRLNSSHVSISYAVFCLKKKKQHEQSKNRI